MFIVNNKKNTRTTSMTCFSCLLGTYFTPFSSVSIVDLEQIKVRWMYLCRTGLLRLRVGLKRQIYVDSQLKHLCRRFSSVFIIVFQLLFTCSVMCLTLVDWISFTKKHLIWVKLLSELYKDCSLSQSVFYCSESTMDISKQCVNYVQSYE